MRPAVAAALRPTRAPLDVERDPAEQALNAEFEAILVGLLLLFAVAMLWLGTLLGVTVRTPDAVTGVAFIVMFPLTRSWPTRSCPPRACPTACRRSPSGIR